MNKGFVFTLDAVFAVILSFLLVGAIILLQQTEKGKERIFETAAQTARDNAMIAEYTNTGGNDSIPANAEYYYSSTIMDYNLPNETVMPRGPVDIALVIDSSESMGGQDIFLKKIDGQTFSGGTCNGGGACNNAADCALPDPSSMQLLGSIDIDADNGLFEIRKGVSTSSGYSGNCTAPKILLKSPTGTFYDFSAAANSNQCMTAPSLVQTNPGDCCYGQLGTGECTNVPITRWPKMQPGSWEIYGWSDSPADFGETYFYITRVDAVKKAAKIFLGNAGWKNQDFFALVGFSSSIGDHGDGVIHYTSVNCNSGGYGASISSCVPLTPDRAQIKDEISKIAPIHGTNSNRGVNVGSMMLASSTKKKYMVLLTDGAASDIGTFLSEAANARSAEITIYAIGFAEASQLQGTAFEDALKQATKDRDSSYCDGILCGKYYFAESGAELNDVYEEIASEITEFEIGTQGQIIRVRRISG